MPALLYSVPPTSAGHCPSMPPPETPEHSQASLAQFLVGTLLLYPGSWCAQVLFVPFKNLFPQSCGSSVIKFHWPAKPDPDILECKDKWALGSITAKKASGGDGIPVELFKILKDDTVKMLHSICQQIWKTQQWPQDWKISVFIPIPKKGNPKECSNYHTIALISHTSKVMLKILQARVQQYVNCELPDVQAGRNQRSNCQHLLDHRKSKIVPEKHLLLLYWLCQSLLLCRSQQTMEHSERDGNTGPPYLPPEKSVCRSRSSS